MRGREGENDSDSDSGGKRKSPACCARKKLSVPGVLAANSDEDPGMRRDGVMVRTCECASEGESGDSESRSTLEESWAVENVRRSSSCGSQTTAKVRPAEGGTTSDQRWSSSPSSEQSAMLVAAVLGACRIVEKLCGRGRVKDKDKDTKTNLCGGSRNRGRNGEDR